MTTSGPTGYRIFMAGLLMIAALGTVAALIFVSVYFIGSGAP